ncbi:hypothetical protein C0J52_12208 [Blattella germanica]|nr:hypothetical protein C0J52_12208 [Blattella germanica]
MASHQSEEGQEDEIGTNIELHPEDIPKHVAQRILRKADEDQNGYLEYQEFIKMTEQEEVKEILHNALRHYISMTVVQPHRAGTNNYESQYSCTPPRVLMVIISILEVLIYLWDIIFGNNSEDMGPAMSIFIYNPFKSVFHLMFNLLVQVALGVPLEMVHGWWRVLLVYLAGVVAGSLGTSISDPAVYLGGASGGVYALIAAHLATIFMNWSEMKYACLQLVIFLPLSMIDTGIAVYTRFVKEGNIMDGFPAHIAGIIAGLLVGINILRNLNWKPWENKIWWASVVIYPLLMLMAIIWNAAFPSYFPPVQ